MIRLHTLSVSAVARCSIQVTEAHAENAAWLANDNANGILSLMLDKDEAGEADMRQAVPVLARSAPVRPL